MNEKKIYLIIGILFIVFLVLFILYNLLNSSVNYKKVTTQNALTPSVSQVNTTIIPNKLLELKYPINFEDINIDYRKDKNQIIVYYKNQKTLAENSFQKFLDQNGVSNINYFNLQVNFIGLTKDPTEPASGFYQK